MKKSGQIPGGDILTISVLLFAGLAKVTHTFGHFLVWIIAFFPLSHERLYLHRRARETSPVYLCPVCLRKLHHACGIHTTRRVMERYNENRKFYGGIWRKAFPDVEDWYKERVARIDNAL